MKTLMYILLVTLTSCAQTPHSKKFIDKELANIKAHAKLLVASGHMTNDYVNRMDTPGILGRYAWHGDGSGYFGAYSFYEPAFEQAKHGWFLHGTVLEGSDEFWPEDDWDDDKQQGGIVFDQSIIGYTLPQMYMAWVQDGKHQGGEFTAKIIGIKDNGHTLLLDKRAPHHAEQWGMAIVPADWKDMCECHSPGPTFVNNRPVVESEDK